MLLYLFVWQRAEGKYITYKPLYTLCFGYRNPGCGGVWRLEGNNIIVFIAIVDRKPTVVHSAQSLIYLVHSLIV